MKSMKNLLPKKETDVPDYSNKTVHEENKLKTRRKKNKEARKSRKANRKRK